MVAIRSLAKSAVDADRRGVAFCFEVETVAVDQLAGVGDLTADADGKLLIRKMIAAAGPGHGACDGEIARAVFHLDDLGVNATRVPKCFMNIPAWTRATKPGEMKAPGTEALGNISCVIDPEEKKRHALVALTLQRGQPMADLLDAGVEFLYGCVVTDVLRDDRGRPSGIVMANRAMCAMLGYSEEELLGLPIGKVRDDDGQGDDSAVDGVEAEEPPLAKGVSVRRKDGSVLLADVHSAPLDVARRRCRLGVYRDMTELNEMEAQMRQAQKIEAIGQLAEDRGETAGPVQVLHVVLPGRLQIDQHRGIATDAIELVEVDIEAGSSRHRAHVDETVGGSADRLEHPQGISDPGRSDDAVRGE